jgi:hypothetical protein
MTTEDMDELQSVTEDASSLGGPGAPTPLSALEASLSSGCCDEFLTDDHLGCRRIDEKRHSTDGRWRLQHSRVSCIYASENT